jgi:type I restriction-modification system DNA methylase subunit
MSTEYTQDQLNKTLWNAADSSRSSVDGGVYKDYALTMLFFKYLSDKALSPSNIRNQLKINLILIRIQIDSSVQEKEIL